MSQEQVREWWNRNPMSYDVDNPIPYEEGSQEYFREIDRRIFHPRYMRLTADAKGRTFGRYVDFVGEELRLPTALAILLAVLVIRPQGLFGHAVVRRV